MTFLEALRLKSISESFQEGRLPASYPIDPPGLFQREGFPPSYPIYFMTVIEVFIGPQCSYCVQAKRILDERGLLYTEYNIAEPEHIEEYRLRLPRSKSIPQIFIDGEHIGSTEDLVILANDGHLDEFRSE